MLAVIEDRLKAIGHGDPLRATLWRVERMRPCGLGCLVLETDDEGHALEWLSRVGAGGVVLGLGADRSVVSIAVNPPSVSGSDPGNDPYFGCQMVALSGRSMLLLFPRDCVPTLIQCLQTLVTREAEKHHQRMIGLTVLDIAGLFIGELRQ